MRTTSHFTCTFFNIILSNSCKVFFKGNYDLGWNIKDLKNGSNQGPSIQYIEFILCVSTRNSFFIWLHWIFFFFYHYLLFSTQETGSDSMNTNTFTGNQKLWCITSSQSPIKPSKRSLSPSSIPYLGAAVLEELEEFGDHDVEGPVESVAVQQLRRVLADLLQCSKRALRHGHTQRGCQIKNANAHRHKGEEEQQRHQKTQLWPGVNARCKRSAEGCEEWFSLKGEETTDHLNVCIRFSNTIYGLLNNKNKGDWV